MSVFGKCVRAALFTGVLGAGAAAVALPALAQDGRPGFDAPSMRQGRPDLRFDRPADPGRYGRGNPRLEEPGRAPQMDRGGMDRGGMGQGGLELGVMPGFACSARATERLEIALVRLSYRLELTEAQRPLFDDLRATALTEQTRFADACRVALEAGRDGGSLLDQLKRRMAVETAHTDAMGAVIPKLEAFYASLSDGQKRFFEPDMGRGGMRPGDGQMQGRGQGGREPSAPEMSPGPGPGEGFTRPQPFSLPG